MIQVPDKCLQFSSRVLGERASQELKAHRVTQTIRGEIKGTSFLVSRGFTMPVFLDGSEVGTVRISEVKRVQFRDLTQWDSEIGGFLTLEELRKALIRAGFRFRPFNEYSGFRIGFTWVRQWTERVY